MTTQGDEFILYPSFLSFESISSTSHSHNPLWLAGVCLDLLSQPADVDIYGAAVADKVPAPHTLKDEFAREHLSLMLGEEDEQFILLWLQCQRLAIESNFAAR